MDRMVVAMCLITFQQAVVVLASGLCCGAVATPDAIPDADADPLLAAHSPYYAYYRSSPIHTPNHTDQTPTCAHNTTKSWCLEDTDYPHTEIRHALHQHYHGIQILHTDTILTTENSVQGVETQEEEAYLCPSETTYVQPLRAVSTEGRWRVIVNNVEVYGENLTQSARIEECLGAPGDSCPLVPPCYQTQCVQKFVYHRFLVFDPYDFIFPFAVETFKLPSSCSCFMAPSL